MLQGDVDSALSNLMHFAEIAGSLADRDPDNIDFQSNLMFAQTLLGETCIRLNQPDEAQGQFEVALESRK